MTTIMLRCGRLLVFVLLFCCCSQIHQQVEGRTSTTQPPSKIASLCRSYYYGGSYYHHDDMFSRQTSPPTQMYDYGYDYSYNDGGDWYPSSSTILPPACDSPQDNPRGVYSSNLATCQLSFHYIPPKTDNGDALHLSTMCSDKNRLTLMPSSKGSTSKNNTKQNGNHTKHNSKKDDSTTVVGLYVTNLYDECVGDFLRCYSLQRDQTVFLNFICSIGIDIPANATHIGIDCTKDKARKQEALAKQSYRDFNEQGIHTFEKQSIDNQEEQVDRWKQVEILIAVLLGFMVVACCCFSLLAYKCMIRPHLESNVHHPHHISEVNTLMTQQDQDDTFSTKASATAAQVL